ncbi:hypothetical protein BHE74_00057401, partial [Ensete ventricosum]
VEFRSVFRAPSRKFKILAIHDVLAQGIVAIRSVFRAPSRKFKILVFPVLLAHGKSYKHAFAKKYDGHKLCMTLRRVEFRSVFSCTVSEIQNTGHSRFEFRSVFLAPSQKFKILAINDVLAHGKSYDHVSRKNATVINFTQS